MIASGRGIEAALGVLAAAMLAGIVHIASLLAMPWLAPDDGYARIARIAPDGRVTVLPRAGGPDDPVSGRDPSVATAVCRFDLSHGPVRVAAARGDALYAALSLHGRTGVTFYGLNDRAGNDGRLELVVMTAAQIAEASARETPDTPIRDVRVQAPGPLGFATFDVLPRVGGSRSAALGSMRCQIEP